MKYKKKNTSPLATKNTAYQITFCTEIPKKFYLCFRDRFTKDHQEPFLLYDAISVQQRSCDVALLFFLQLFNLNYLTNIW